MSLKRIGFWAFGLFTIIALLSLINHYGFIAVHPTLLLASRWVLIVILFLFGLKRRTLTAWIFICMVMGAEIGHDFPEVAVHLQVLSKVFLKLIKSVVAPLLFGTLVYGIA